VVAYHYYDGTAGGAPRLGLRKLAWDDDGWPKIPAGDAPGARRASP
jgi:arabinan endo-1,5-alpha-L-arabinosidase